MSTLPDGFDLRIRAAAAAALRTMRLDASLSQAEVSRRSGIARPIVCRNERGVHTVSLHVAHRQAVACGGTITDVLRHVDQVLGLGGVAA